MDAIGKDIINYIREYTRRYIEGHRRMGEKWSGECFDWRVYWIVKRVKKACDEYEKGVEAEEMKKADERIVRGKEEREKMDQYGLAEDIEDYVEARVEENPPPLRWGERRVGHILRTIEDACDEYKKEAGCRQTFIAYGETETVKDAMMSCSETFGQYSGEVEKGIQEGDMKKAVEAARWMKSEADRLYRELGRLIQFCDEPWDGNYWEW